MIHQIINFTDKYPESNIVAYIHSPAEELKIDKRKAIIVCPGGGFAFLSDREAEPVALKYFAEGLNVFILNYSLNENAVNFAPIIEACLAIKYIREHSDELYVNPEFIFITGFSAGGYVSAAASAMWHIPLVQDAVGNCGELCRPTASILCYPVITNKPCRHKLSMLRLNGMVDDESTNRFSVEEYVNEKTVPSFIWHTANDNGVPVGNSLIYANKLAEYKIPFELHIFPNGNHGLSLCNKETWVQNPSHLNPYCEPWFSLALNWIDKFPSF